MTAGLSTAFDDLLLRALGRTGEPRFESATAFKHALEVACGPDVATAREVGELAQASL